MSRQKVLFFSILILFISNVYAQDIRGLYVNKTDSILGNSLLEKELLDYLTYGNYNSISFYSLNSLNFSDSDTRALFRSFIRKAKKEYGITRVGAVSESLLGFMDNIHFYNQDSLTLPDDRLDHYNIEFEFWSNSSVKGYYCERYLAAAGYACNTDGAFSYVMNMIKELRSQSSDIPGIEIDIYIGWIDAEHAAHLATQVDRILYAVYRDMKSDGSIELYNFSSQRARLESFGSSVTAKLSPIFTSYDGTSDPSLAEWLNAGHTVCEAWENYEAGFQADDKLENKASLSIDGYQWFKYSSMPSIPIVLKTPGPVMGPRSLNVKKLGKYTFPPIEGAVQYEWSIYKSGSNFRKLTNYPVLTKIFDEPGPAMIQVRALGCGEVSPYARFTINIKNLIYAEDTLVFGDNDEFKIKMTNQGMHLTIPSSKKGPFYIEALSLMGKKHLKKTLSSPGEYYLEFQQITDSVQFLHVSITHPNGSFSKKFSIFPSGDGSRPY